MYIIPIAPNEAKCCIIESPMPDVPPVTTTILFSRRALQ